MIRIFMLLTSFFTLSSFAETYLVHHPDFRNMYAKIEVDDDGNGYIEMNNGTELMRYPAHSVIYIPQIFSVEIIYNGLLRSLPLFDESDPCHEEDQYQYCWKHDPRCLSD